MKCDRMHVWVLLFGLLSVVAVSGIEVERIVVPYETSRTLTLDNTVEYIVEFSQSSEQALWPVSRLALAAGGGDPARPLLLTARQPAGAQTWQLPYLSEDGEQVLFALERTLCFNLDERASASDVRARLSLHASSAANVSTELTVRVDPVRDAELPFDTLVDLTVTQTAPRVLYYTFKDASQSSARLVVSSPDDLCAMVSVHNFSCPVAETRAAAARDGLRMTVQRSGGAHIARSSFPNGFYLTALVLDSDVSCSGESEPAPDWLWEAAAGLPGRPALPDPARARVKALQYELKPALSRSQYAVASVVTLVVFALFYAAFVGAVLAQRFEPVLRFVGPKAVLAENNEETEADNADRRMRRRDSDATLDSMDNDSESDEERAPTPAPRATPPAGPPTSPPAASTAAATNNDVVVPNGTNGVHQTSAGETQADAPFGLPAVLHVSDLARRREPVLRARSDRYLHTLWTVAVFYALPVLQFVAAFQIVLNVSGSLDLCYYNFLCAHPAGALSDFNHVFSNAGYVLLGALFLLQVRRRRRRRKSQPRHQDYGIPAHYGLLSALGAGLMMVGLLSASYHVCPNRLNFQFDTAFMFVLAVLSMVKIYQARHPDINARAHSTFGVLAVLIALVVWGVLGGGALFWAVFTVLHVFSVLLLSLRIYYVGQFRLDSAGLSAAARGVRSLRAERPLYAPRLAMLLAANAVNWAYALYGLVTMPTNFASHLLFVLLSNVLLHLTSYLAMKLLAGERPRWYVWALLAAAAAAWAPALYFFVSGSSDWSATPAQSRHLNHECRVLQFYDSHDLWHMLSAVALYLTFNVMLTMDDGLSAVKRTEIAVF